MHKVLITGITGFLGSHIAEKLISEGVQVIGLKRPASNTWRCNEFTDKMEWVDLVNGYQDVLTSLKPDTIIHCAWIGVESKDRDNWTLQKENVHFLVELLELSKTIELKKFVILGSQAEYGLMTGKIAENAITDAKSAYGSVKLACLQIFKSFCMQKDIVWIWLRVFSVFGEREDHNWLIPSVIYKMKNGLEMDFTAGEQKYAYLYVKDFAIVISKVIGVSIESGIYNVSGSKVLPLRVVIERIRNIVNPEFKLNFGALPYRLNQPMHIEGDSMKLTKEIGKLEYTNFNVALHQTIKYYLNKI